MPDQPITYFCDIEVWKAITNFPGYEVSTFGRFRTWRANGRPFGKKKPKILKPWVLKKRGRYYAVSLFKEGKYYAFTAHSIVLREFIGPRPEGKECRHLDGNPQNPRLDNLEWATHQNNCEDKKRHGTARIGQDNINAKLTHDEVVQIKKHLAINVSQAVIARKFDISPQTICNIAHERTWAHA